MSVLAIDPGTTDSAWVAFDGHKVIEHGIVENDKLCGLLMLGVFSMCDTLVVEQIESFGMAVGRETFETVWYAGRFHQCAGKLKAFRMTRRDVKLHLCKSMKAKDANIRQALIDKFGGVAAIGVKKTPGPLYGIRSHEWSALAIAVTWMDTKKAGV